MRGRTSFGATRPRGRLAWFPPAPQLAGATLRRLDASEMPHEIPLPSPGVLIVLLCGEHTAHLVQPGCNQRPLQPSCGRS